MSHHFEQRYDTTDEKLVIERCEQMKAGLGVNRATKNMASPLGRFSLGAGWLMHWLYLHDTSLTGNMRTIVPVAGFVALVGVAFFISKAVVPKPIVFSEPNSHVTINYYRFLFVVLSTRLYINGKFGLSSDGAVDYTVLGLKIAILIASQFWATLITKRLRYLPGFGLPQVFSKKTLDRFGSMIFTKYVDVGLGVAWAFPLSYVALYAIVQPKDDGFELLGWPLKALGLYVMAQVYGVHHKMAIPYFAYFHPVESLRFMEYGIDVTTEQGKLALQRRLGL
ncbi:hypothetical protein B0I72DRAFT_114953 [Yarrowia lipolytica]|jgi:hypothetical protein|uniref:YALI0E00704p n=2 Tax=Yarrowia lipolytica TaxID=4952 RepID=Q6C7H9_YARLI|nr:YALI0E00704p [Yarrowia lipolytica CLIB122]AOW04772.1 hypothetical protein YALI1_E01081g [Yarrowia lipolytica]KAB8282826.1 hypothetical protein BKA91DRAFT_112700 [Yarrowia lipolytica]KAE8174549.1 hypothetical protein BKA90DRAFT_158223 [Yarrowia lipolytica]KAJ8056355.1 hypothetical protein LXG23DRAFT_33253 [Yarrowia lipolytica]QNQ00437.1 Hypothetical protein YALI2_E01752g [Yarrowia lipolytica]|eukprot:XP_503383.1 YALI0E00704p [Yarrowia lipolytica CLIB122]